MERSLLVIQIMIRSLFHYLIGMKYAELYCWLIINPTKIFPTIVQQKKHQLGGRLEHLELQQASVQYLSADDNDTFV